MRNDDLRWVPRLRGLHCLYFNDADWPGGFRLNREGLGFILQARELTDLVIPVGPDIDGIPEELAGLDQLRFLRIVGPIGGSGMHAIARLPKLEALFLDGCALSPDVAVLFQRGFPSLYTLGIRNATVPTEIWEALAEAGSLDTLIIASVDGQSLPLEQVGRIASLGRLSISGTDLSGKDISALSELKDLRHLDVVSAGVDTRQASAVTWPPALRRLDLSGNPIGAEFLRQACLPPLLGALHVEHTGISGDDVVAASRVNPRIGRICIYTGEAFRDSMPEDVKTPVEEPSKTQ